MSDTEINELQADGAGEGLTPPDGDATETLEVTGLKTQLADLTAQMEDVVKDLQTAAADLTDRDKQIADLKAQLAAKPKGRVSAGATPPKPRKAGPMKEGAAVTGADLRELIAAAGEGEVEIVFSDGKTELAGVPPVRVDGDVWKEHAIGLMLRDPVDITGPAQPTSMGGYALFIDDKQVAWTPRDAVPLAPGSKVRLADDVYFA